VAAGQCGPATKLNREQRFSWAAVASALNEVGILYRTGDHRTATNLAEAVSEVRRSFDGAVLAPTARAASQAGFA